MKVILFGATGMVGQGVLRECLLDGGVESVLSIVRAPSGVTDAKLRECVHRDFADFRAIETELAGYDACFFCLGISAAGLSEDAYRHITYDYTLAAARTLAKVSPKLTFVYVSGAGTDSSEKGRAMWARVKGKTENDLLKVGLHAAFMFRPAAIQPMHGARSRTALYRWFYLFFWPFWPVLKFAFPSYVTTTERVGVAMLHVARHGAAKPVLENRDINAVAREASARTLRAGGIA